MHKSFCNECQSVEPYKVDRIDGSWECRSCGFAIECVECGGTMSDRHDCRHAVGRESVEDITFPDSTIDGVYAS